MLSTQSMVIIFCKFLNKSNRTELIYTINILFHFVYLNFISNVILSMRCTSSNLLFLCRTKPIYFRMTVLIIGQTDNEQRCWALCNFYLWNCIRFSLFSVSHSLKVHSFIISPGLNPMTASADGKYAHAVVQQPNYREKESTKDTVHRRRENWCTYVFVCVLYMDGMCRCELLPT